MSTFLTQFFQLLKPRAKKLGLGKNFCFSFAVYVHLVLACSFFFESVRTRALAFD